MRFTHIDRQQLPGVFLIVITMTALAVFIQVDRMKNKSADLRARAYKQTPTGVRVEAEEMTLSGVVVDSGGTFIQFADSSTTPSSAMCPPSGEPVGGTAMIDVDLNIAANYKMWIQMRGKGDNANTVWLQLDNQYCAKVGDMAGMSSDTWEWIDYQNGDSGNRIPTPIIGTGHHIVKLIGNGSEPGVAIDRFIMMIDASCIPSGNGDACIGVVSTPTPTPIPTPTLTPTPTITTTSKRNPVEAPVITTSSLPKAIRNSPYAADIVATDVTIADTLSLAVVKLPAGLTISACSQIHSLGGTTLTCGITGTPTAKGITVSEFTVTDALGNKSTKRIKLQVE